jgi:hypothetical protein
MSSAQNRPTGGQARPASTGTGDPGSAGARSAGNQEGYPSETVDYGQGVPGQGYPSESAEYGRGPAQGYPRTGPRGRGRTGAGESRRHLGLGAALAILTGLLTFFGGIVGILKGLFFTTVSQYPYSFSARGRGIVDIVIGAVLVLLGVCLLLGMHWARTVTVVVAVLAAIGNFMFLPFYPFWSIVLLALDVFIIWELARAHHAQRQQA